LRVETEPYLILPFRFCQFSDRDVLVVNDAGEYLFLKSDAFQDFISYKLSPASSSFLDLKGKHLLTDTAVTPVIDLLATKYRTKRAFLSNFTALHMVVVTVRCNHRCHYCHASSQSANENRWDMDRATAVNVANTIMQTPSPEVKIEFQGGEPLLNFEIVKIITHEAKRINRHKQKNLSFVICTNLTLMDDAKLGFLKKEGITISTSLDGPKEIHDLHRVMQNGNSSYDALIANLQRCRQLLGHENVSALMTITKDSLSHLDVIIDEYLHRGFESIFLRSLNPYGYARSGKHAASLSYDVESFLEAYIEALDHIIQINLRGQRFLEFYATILLSRILTPFSTGFVDLQSPSGAGLSGVVYNFDGDVYPTDESRMLAMMGDRKFRMGSVNDDSYAEIFLSPTIRELANKSCVETLPGCHSCAFQVFCGTDPVRNYALQGDIVGHRPTSEFCTKNQGIIRHLLRLIEKGDPDTMDVFWSWITNRPLSEIRGIKP
jgi:uncharacterized protein